MNFEDWIIPKLNNLPDQREALDNIPREIHALEARMEVLKSVGADLTKKKVSKEGEELLSCALERDQLASNLKVIREEIAVLEGALAALAPEERLSLERLYIHRRPDSMKALCSELDLEERQANELKWRALIRLARKMFGIVSL